ncbi:MAG: hypothetical protein HZA61_05455 [Candidatus Eisenbacteria bacterium]|uniref:Uncharacterized protein n=1 Tax=Eiseniibacteriota bacterium TaxID=2212470 RepID=A0A933W1C3_UNCEI|nr:hypothetical protein [Candidatus Eisenbacteria bacterium]
MLPIRPWVLAALLGAGASSSAWAGTEGPRPDSTIAFPSAADRRWQTGLVRRDRLQHASLSFVLAGAARTAGRPRGEAFALSLSAGVLKEVRDARHDRFDLVDLAADALGAALGAALPGERRD